MERIQRAAKICLRTQKIIIGVLLLLVVAEGIWHLGLGSFAMEFSFACMLSVLICGVFFVRTVRENNKTIGCPELEQLFQNQRKNNKSLHVEIGFGQITMERLSYIAFAFRSKQEDSAEVATVRKSMRLYWLSVSMILVQLIICVVLHLI